MQINQKREFSEYEIENAVDKLLAAEQVKDDHELMAACRAELQSRRTQVDRLPGSNDAIPTEAPGWFKKLISQKD